MRNRMAALALLAGAAPAAAELRSSAPGGFESVHVATVAAPPAEVFAALGTPARWWTKGHTYSGDAANLRLELRAGGCFCERVPADGSTIEHGRVVYAQPGKVLRLSAALGPLQAEGVAAALTWTLKPVAGGTEVTQSYVVGGYVRGGADTLAPIVDRVMGEQLNGLRAAFARR
jgi:uncharacterized protein YndB with AHSA1/START domain